MRISKKERKRKKKLQMRNKRLIKKYYFLCPRNVFTDQIPKDYDYTWIDWWDFDSGWGKAFGWQYLKELGDAINKSGQKNFRIWEIKEKFGCYDPETEVLTKAGWKFFKELSYEDEIATLNQDNGYLEYQNPTEIIAERYNGKMYRLENRGISLCVTPNHNLYVAKGSDFRGKKGNFTKHYNDFELCNPQKYYGLDKRFLKSCKWSGVVKYKKYKIKGIEYDSPCKNNDENTTFRHYIKKDLEFDLLPWLRFLGFYIAEGTVANKKDEKRHGEIIISFNPYKEKQLVEKLINDIGFKSVVDVNNGTARFYNQTLGMWLNDNCGHGAINKKVPNFIKELPSEYIIEFLKYLYIGDGYKAATSNILTTISKQLSNDVQELLLKAGYSFRERMRNRVGGFGGYVKNNYQVIHKHVCYEINWLQLPDIEIDMSKTKKTKSFQEKWIDYSGYVYCVTVPNHVIYIRRNGKGLWCGNSLRVYTSGTTREVHSIIDKYEKISENVCYYCGKEAPMTDDGWMLPQCFKCFCKIYRRREQYWNEYHSQEPVKFKTDEELREIYNEIVCDKPDDNGEYHIPDSYRIRRGVNGEWQDIDIDISETAEKIRKRISNFM